MSESHWIEGTGSRRFRSQSMAARSETDRIDLVEAEQAHHGGTLGPEATHWARSLLEVSRFELARADDKANTLFRFYGVVAALSIGLLAGGGWSPSDFDTAAQVAFWSGCAALLASGVYLGMTLYPRNVRGTPADRLLYFGHVTAYSSVEELTEALRPVEHDSEHRLVEQLLSVSRLVSAKYLLTRKALIALAVGTALCVSSVILNALINR